jgi:multicomponent Na+:H+ antiporter subunit B
MPTPSPIVRYVSRRAIPAIQLYALYVLGHGEDGPGGGFQGGVIFAASLVLLALVDGYQRGRRDFPEGVSDALAPLGCIIYAGIGMACLLAGGMFLQYEAFLGPGASGEAAREAHMLGLTGIEIGVMLTVSASMVTLYFEMARPGDDVADAEEESDA